MEVGFFIKKFISFFIEPFGIVVLSLLLGVYLLYVGRYRYAKVFIGSSLFFLLLFSYPPFALMLVKNLENIYSKYDYKSEVSYIHVLGSGHDTDETQPISSKLSDAGVKRVLEGVVIHKKTKNSKLIFTGYKGDTDISNAQMNASLAQALGVDEQNIIIGDSPKDTKEEALFTKNILGGEPFVLVTSASHMPRSIKLFKSHGLNPIAAPTDFHKEEFRGFFVKPEIHYFDISQKALHEYYGTLWSIVKP